MFRLQSVYYCSCALRGSSNTTALAFYIDSPFFEEIVIVMFNLLSQYCKVIGWTLHTQNPCTSGQISWLTGRRADYNDELRLIRATVTLPPQEVRLQVRLKVKQAVSSTRSFSFQSFAGFHSVQYGKWWKWMPRWSRWVDDFQVAQTTSNSPTWHLIC